MHIMDEIRALLNQIPAQLAQHPTIARGIGEYVQAKVNDELKSSGVPYQVGIQFTGALDVTPATV